MGYLRLAGFLVLTIAASACAKGNPETSGTTSASSSASGTGGATSSASSAASGTGGATGSSASGTGGAAVCQGDCADPACVAAGYLCVEPVSGWSGPVVLFDGDPATLPAACPAAFPDQVYSGVRGPAQAAPAQCAACACGAGTASCALGAVHLYTDLQCTNPEAPPFAQPAASGCQPIMTFGSPNNPIYLLIDSPTATGTASCPPAGGGATLPTATWTAAALACGATSVSACGTSGACLPPAPAPFGGKACIYEAGDLSCPGAYPHKHRLTGASDTRACSACGCASSGPATCTATTTLYGDLACTQQLTVKTDNGICGQMFGFVQAAEIALQTAGSPSCASSGGQPTGQVTDDGQVTTFCCVE